MLFFRQEQKTTNPIVDIVLLKSTPFLAANLFNIIVGAAFLGIFAFVPLYATSVHRLSTLASGMILTPRSIGVIAASAVTSFLLKRLGYRWPMVAGACTISCAAILLAKAHTCRGCSGPDWESRRSSPSSCWLPASVQES